MSIGVYFVSLGCPKNLVDSEVMLGCLSEGPYHRVSEPEQAEVIIVNTCAFIEASQKESIDLIFEMAHWKEEGRCRLLVASGCLPQRYPSELEKLLPEVDLFVGTGQYHRIRELLEKEPLASRSYIDQPAFIHTEKNERVHTGALYRAYLKISEGCNRRCSFCIIPKLRGNVRSRTVSSLVAEAEGMAKRGVRELNLVAQDLSEYGMEWKYRERLETLLPALCRVQGIEWIRLHYLYPDAFSEELLEIVAREPKIVKYLDMPIQHTCDRVLKMMNRRLTRSRLFELVENIRKKIPSMVFRTSIIVGFPGETQEEFEMLCQDLMELRLDYVGVFSYSQEDGTAAAELGQQIHPQTKRKRLRILTELLEQNALEQQKKYLKKRAPALIEGVCAETDALLEARLASQAEKIDGRVLINDLDLLDPSEQKLLRAGDFVEVEITEVLPYDLVARVTRVLQPYRFAAEYDLSVT
jgi:ribosomal protein S12 methylthiotransferase